MLILNYDFVHSTVDLKAIGIDSLDTPKFEDFFSATIDTGFNAVRHLIKMSKIHVLMRVQHCKCTSALKRNKNYILNSFLKNTNLFLKNGYI